METINNSGRRKRAVASIYLKPGTGLITINKKDYKDYFPTLPLQFVVNQPFQTASTPDKNWVGIYDVDVNVKGGGISGQAGAIRLAIAKSLVEIDSKSLVEEEASAVKSLLRAKGLMTSDYRKVERKKPGQKKARKKFQFSKR